MRHHVIYVPGLGDYRTRMQRLAPIYWQLFGITGHYYLMRWNDKQSFEPKLAGLLEMIDQLSINGDKVSLVGTSAGASAVLDAFAVRQEKVSGVVCICGKINHPETIRPGVFIENPAFKESLANLQLVLPGFDEDARAQIMSIRPLADHSVPPPDTVIDGARALVVPTYGHVASIAFSLIFAAPGFIGFLKSLPPK
ncbi:MAG TPA: hypothetical protein VL737_00575 [Candidatus Pristimantibacillus sp.]|nr:hypothetical protein [Candidatus Pristimantibacillus sp.]